MLLFWALLWEIPALYFLILLTSVYSSHHSFNTQPAFLLSLFWTCSLWWHLIPVSELQDPLLLKHKNSYTFFLFLALCWFFFFFFLPFSVCLYALVWLWFALCLLCSNIRWARLSAHTKELMVHWLEVLHPWVGLSTSYQPGHFLEIPVVWVAPGLLSSAAQIPWRRMTLW